MIIGQNQNYGWHMLIFTMEIISKNYSNFNIILFTLEKPFKYMI